MDTRVRRTRRKASFRVMFPHFTTLGLHFVDIFTERVCGHRTGKSPEFSMYNTSDGCALVDGVCVMLSSQKSLPHWLWMTVSCSFFYSVFSSQRRSFSLTWISPISSVTSSWCVTSWAYPRRSSALSRYQWASGRWKFMGNWFMVILERARESRKQTPLKGWLSQENIYCFRSRNSWKRKYTEDYGSIGSVPSSTLAFRYLLLDGRLLHRRRRTTARGLRSVFVEDPPRTWQGRTSLNMVHILVAQMIDNWINRTI